MIEKVSVIVPTRNRTTYMRDLLEDLRKQELLPAEVIIVDQSDVRESLTDCIQLFDSNVGPCRARNLGIERSIGDIIIFLDDDIRLESDFIKKIMISFNSPSIHAVTFANCTITGEYHYEKAADYLNQDTDHWFRLLTANPNYPGKRTTLSFPAGCSAIRKSVLNEVGGFDEFFDPTGAGEDREFGYRLFKYGFQVVYDGTIRILHIGAPIGGSRDLGSRRLNLDTNIAYTIAKHFNLAIFNSYKNWIKLNYRNSLIKKLGRTSLRNYFFVRKRIKEIERIRLERFK